MAGRGIRRRRGLVLVLALLVPGKVPAAGGEDLALWRTLDWFRGAWRGREAGLLGEGRGLRCVQDLFAGRFMLLRTRSELQLASDRSERRTFVYWQLLGRDPDSGRITLTQYESAGYRRRFELDAAASRPDGLVFRARFLGDASPARTGRLTLRVLGEGLYAETLELGESRSTLREVRRSRWQRLETQPEACAAERLRLPEP